MAAERRSVLCVGLDPRPDLFPDEVFRGVRDGPAGLARAMERFCTGIVDAVAEHAVAVKPQLAFFEQAGHNGLAAVERIAEHARERGLLVIADGKRGDIGSTAEAYASAYLAAAALVASAGRCADRQPVSRSGLAGAVRGRLPGVRRPGCSSSCARRIPAAPTSRSSSWPTARACGSAWRASSTRSPRSPAPSWARRSRVRSRERGSSCRGATFLLPGIGAQGGDVASLGPAFAPGAAGGLVSASRSVLYASRENGAGRPRRRPRRAASERRPGRSWRAREQAGAPTATEETARAPGARRSPWNYLAPAALLLAVTAITLILASAGVLGHTSNGDSPVVTARGGPVETLPVPSTAPPPAPPPPQPQPVPPPAPPEPPPPATTAETTASTTTTTTTTSDAATTRDDDGDDQHRRPAREVDGQARRHAGLDRHAVRDDRARAPAPESEHRSGHPADRAGDNRAQ